VGDAVGLLDLDDTDSFARQCATLGLGQSPPTDAEPVGAINWASTAPGIDWPERYRLATSPDGSKWILWVESDIEASPVEREEYPVGWCSIELDAKSAAKGLLAAYWSWTQRFGQDRFQFAEAGRLLDEDQLQSVADRVWGPGASEAHAPWSEGADPGSLSGRL
jgi:hypothetical protein